MSQFTKASELHRAWANWLEMCEGTKVDVNSGWKCGGGDAAFHSPSFQGKFSDYEIAIGIVEGKPVFVGDELYRGHEKVTITDRDILGCLTYEQNGVTHAYATRLFSWSPPKTKPKTTMVEMLVEDIEYWSGLPSEYPSPRSRRFYEACRKTLENYHP